MNGLNSTYCQAILNATFSSTFVGSSFTGKEKDSESGYHYFGARYYDSEALTGWLSVDPMSDKYPNMSPYNYCAWTRPTGGDEHRWIKYNIVNNPVKLKDPDGTDWYEVDAKGNVMKDADKSKDYLDKDVLHATKTDEQLELPENFILTISTAPFEFKNENIEGIEIDLSSKEEYQMKVFKFVANNTDVEWSLISMSNTDKKVYYCLTNSHSDGSEDVWGRRNDDYEGALIDGFVEMNNWTLNARIHNHGDIRDNPPNQQDKAYAKKYSSANHYIYFPKEDKFVRMTSINRSGFVIIKESQIRGL